jgi:hypothetical protein
MDPFAMATLRDVFSKRGVAVADSDVDTSALPHSLDVTAPMVPLPPVTLGWDSPVPVPAPATPLRSASVGYLLSSAVKDCPVVGVEDTRARQWSAQSLAFRLPAIRDADAVVLTGPVPLTALTAAISSSGHAHILVHAGGMPALVTLDVLARGVGGGTGPSPADIAAAVATARVTMLDSLLPGVHGALDRPGVAPIALVPFKDPVFDMAMLSPSLGTLVLFNSETLTKAERVSVAALCWDLARALAASSVCARACCGEMDAPAH